MSRFNLTLDRFAVLVAGLLTAVLFVQLIPLHGMAMLVVIALAVLDAWLLHSTRALAFRRTSRLDEREVALRDHAYRAGFRRFGGLLLLALVVSSFTAPLFQISQLADGMPGRELIGVAELLLMLPTFSIAWRQRTTTDAEPRRSDGVRALAWMAAAAVSVIAAWLLAVALLPLQVVGASSTVSIGFDTADASCIHVATGRMVGAQFGAVVALQAEVCWTGKDAYAVGDPAFPLPADATAGLPAGSPTPPPVVDPFLTSCGAPDFLVRTWSRRKRL